MAKNIIAKTCVIIGLIFIQLCTLACCGVARGSFLAMIGIVLIPFVGIVRMRVATVREVLFKALGQIVLCVIYGVAAVAIYAFAQSYHALIGVQFVLSLGVIAVAAMIWFIRPKAQPRNKLSLKKDPK